MRKVIALLTLVVFSTQMLGCNSSVVPKSLDTGMQRLTQLFDSESSDTGLPGGALRADEAKQIQASAQAMVQAVTSPPQLEGTLTADPNEAVVFVNANKQKIFDWLNQVQDSTAQGRKLIYDISKQAYQSTDNRVIVRDYAMLYFAIQYQRGLFQSMLSAATPFMLAVGADSLKDVPEITEFRQELTNRFFAFLGSQMVAAKDLEKVGETLKAMRDQGALTASLKTIISNVHKALKKRSSAHADRLKQVLSKLSDDDRTKVESGLKQFLASYENTSFLYSPDQNLGALANTLIVIGNLTWGLFNTLLGAAVVLGTMIVSPFTSAVDFPTFALAVNKHMIYVNVTGMGPMAGKMSLGLFELDNGTGYDFASGHEGIHAIQSAVLGPLFLPAVLISYVVSGFDQGYFETQADNYAWIDS